jgi:Rieske Fe-S protein
MFPDVLYEPPKAYKIGGPQDYLDGVNYIPEKRIFVVRKGTLFKVISAVCTHIGCTVRWEADRNQWECPCHGSIFDDKGAVIVGPAPRPLPWYEVTLAANGRLFVNQRGIVPFSGTFSVKT